MNKTLRTKNALKDYEEYKKNYKGNEKDYFSDWSERLIKKYKHWLIISADFPYDLIASKHHLLITKRIVDLDWEKLSQEEIKELLKVRKDIKYDYDMVMENLPSSRSIPKHFHIHLIVLKDQDIKTKNEKYLKIEKIKEDFNIK